MVLTFSQKWLINKLRQVFCLESNGEEIDKFDNFCNLRFEPNFPLGRRWKVQKIEPCSKLVEDFRKIVVCRLKTAHKHFTCLALNEKFVLLNPN